MSYYIPQEIIDSVAELLLPDIREFAESDLGNELIAAKRKELEKTESYTE